MAEAPEGVLMFEVIPANYDKIIERSKNLPPWEEPYTVEKLDRMRNQALARGSLAYIMFMDPDFWTKERYNE